MQSDNQIVAAITSVNEAIEQTSSVGIIYYVVNFAIPFIVSFVTFPFHVANIKKESLIRTIILIQGLERDPFYKRTLRIFKVQSALITGLASCALISFQFRGVNIVWAIFFGLLGPFAVRDRLAASLERTVLSTEVKKVQEATESIESGVVLDMKRIEKSIREQVDRAEQKEEAQQK